MNSERIISLLDARPFRPFTLFLAGHSDVLIDNPKLVQVLDEGQTLLVSGGPDNEVDRFETMIDLNLVAAVRRWPLSK